MPRTPPLLPSEVLRRVLRTARLDGTIVLVLSGAFAVIAAAAHDVIGAGTGIAIAAAGAMELHGTGLLRRFEEKGMRWLIASQLFLMACILAYVSLWLNQVPIEQIKASIRSLYTPDQLAQLRSMTRDSNLTPDEALRQLKSFFCDAVVIGTVIYQGGMSIYYSRRRAAVAAALQEGD
ncbi:MAG: hypothetical protein ABSA05_03210 [Opitutaceae bacterium]